MSRTGINAGPSPGVPGPGVHLGTEAFSFTTPIPPDASANLNRLEVIAPGVGVKSTIASGDRVGDQVGSSGLVRSNSPAKIIGPQGGG